METAVSIADSVTYEELRRQAYAVLADRQREIYAERPSDKLSE